MTIAHVHDGAAVFRNRVICPGPDARYEAQVQAWTARTTAPTEAQIRTAADRRLGAGGTEADAGRERTRRFTTAPAGGRAGIGHGRRGQERRSSRAGCAIPVPAAARPSAPVPGERRPRWPGPPGAPAPPDGRRRPGPPP